ncbi:biosynthetic peptidoglycan transglycosylase [Pelotalea chapellei]|uniref:Transglycosylase domain-containing protein n=1 Tax=Pelotalea chapellei TaxID=44671 RepID=A0ABS5UBQ9_9BACT|nr:biosynthetic peptidoglycan transglycosylase [Pelotalea chapellei]MBT1072931.1 transglycosylase domain-containing protein [Pelotalea chapellei]
MELHPQDSRTRFQRSLAIVVIAMLASALAAFGAFNYLSNKASALAGSLTGMNCVVSSVGPCFPWGIKASDITICSTSGEPLFEAKEIHSQVNLRRYLQKNSAQSDIFGTLYGDQIKLTLTRNDRGEWNSPQLAASRKIRGTAQEGIAFPRRLSFTNVTILVKTGAGESTRFYKSLEADLDPAKHSVSLKLSGDQESARITLIQGTAKQYHLHADNFSIALLAPVSTVHLPLANLAVTGNLTATTNDDKNFAIKGSGTLVTQGLRSPLISSKTVDGFHLPFDLKADLTGSGIENLAATISLAGERALVQGNIQGWDKPVIDLTTKFQNFSYDNAIDALPPSLRPSLPAIRLSGSMTGIFRIHLDMAEPDSLDYRFTGHTDRLGILNLGGEIDIKRLKGEFLHKVRMKPEKEIPILLSPENPDFIPYAKIPFSLKSAVMAAEDPRFFSHRGFSTRHIRGALVDNLKAGRVVRGASTISMQLAKNLFLSPERTLSRKLEEVLITVALEQNLDKKRMMEIYLNIIEWGDGIYGIGPASRYYFGKSPAKLSPVESAFLASIIARPKNWPTDPLSKVGRGWQEYLRVILCKMYRLGAANDDDLLNAGVSEARIEQMRHKETEAEQEDSIVTPPSPAIPPLLTDAVPAP